MKYYNSAAATYLSSNLIFNFIVIWLLLVNNKNVNANEHDESPVFHELNEHHHKKQHHHHHNNHNRKSEVTERCHLIPSKEQIVFTNYDASSLYLNKSVNELKRHNRHLSIVNKKNQNKRKSNEHFIIYPYYHESFSNLPKDILSLYKDQLIPEAINYWQSSLQVKYPYFPIYLGRICATSQHYYSDLTKSVSCETNCADHTKCGDYIVIPEEHLDVCRYCTNGGHNCSEKGHKHEGVNADFILYISSITTEHCNISNTVAFASYCQLESKYNRPVAGYVNICPGSVSAKQSDIHSALATLKHEILHALGFSAGLYAFFLDSNGLPLTQRDKHTGKPPFNQNSNMYEPSELVVKTIVRHNWKISDHFIDRNVTMIVTPKVVQEVRKHFNCSTLEGAELEDQGEIGTKLTHWEKRVFENEAMTGTYTQNSVFSRITFAFLEDTGWYVANYSHAEELTWGKNLGCGFAKKSCKHWIDEKKARNESIRPFCNNIPNVAGITESKYECNANKDAVLLCNLQKYHHSIPVSYRNFDSTHHQNHLHSDANEFTSSNPVFSYLGGSVVLADYCPFMQQVSWSVSSDQIRDSKCSFDENKPDKSKNYVLEEYGKESKCFLHNRTWQIYSEKCSSRITVSKTIGCYAYKCDLNEGGLLVRVNDQYFKCAYKNQILDFRINTNSMNKNLSIYFGNLICPACIEMCSSDECPAISEASTNMKTTEAVSQEETFMSHLRFSHNNNKESTFLNLQHSECLKIVTLNSGSIKLINDDKFIIFFLILFFSEFIMVYF